jgi:signal transduction histidine kinase
MLRNVPIKRKILWVIILTSIAVLLVTFFSYFIYEVITFRQSAVHQLSTSAKIISSNSTAALAFESEPDAREILTALKADQHVVAAALYRQDGSLFAYYAADSLQKPFPSTLLLEAGHRFEDSSLIVLEPVVQKGHTLGTLYLKSDMNAMYERLKLYATIAAAVGTFSLIVAYLISMQLQRSISNPVLALTETAKAVSERKDYTVRATKAGNDEIGFLTEAFNQMLSEIQEQNARIQRFNQELEQKVHERTQDLEAVNKELEAFSYSVSHDLRAPLRSVIGFASILQEDYAKVMDEHGLRSLETIMRNGHRMGQLIDDLLAFSRLGKQTITRIDLDMNLLTQNVTDELAGQYRVDAEVHIHPLPNARGDSGMLRQVMQNLISNALKYSMKKDKPVVEIGAFNENGCNVYYVKDNGAGFNMKYYDKLFGVFQRLHGTNEFEGTGVGLALVHRVILRHNGEIWAEGKENEGATFFFSLPAPE